MIHTHSSSKSSLFDFATHCIVSLKYTCKCEIVDLKSDVVNDLKRTLSMNSDKVFFLNRAKIGILSYELDQLSQLSLYNLQNGICSSTLDIPSWIYKSSNLAVNVIIFGQLIFGLIF